MIKKVKMIILGGVSKDALSLLFSQLIIIVIGFSTTVVWANMATVELYGQYSLVISYLSIAAIFALGGLNTSLELGAARNQDGMLKAVLKKKFVAGLLTAPLILIFAYYHYCQGQNIIAIVLAVLFFVYPLRVVVEMWKPWLNGGRNFHLYAMQNVIAVIVVFASIFFSLFLKLSLINTVIVVMLSHLLINGFFLFSAYFKTKNNSFSRESLDYGLSISFIFIINSLLLFDKALIHYFSGDIKLVALYSISLTFSLLAKTLFDVTNKLLIPIIAGAEDINEAWLLIKGKVWIFSCFFIFSGVFGFLTLDSIIPIIFSSKYIAAAGYASWFWLLTCLAIPSSYILTIIRYHGYKKLLFWDALLNVASKFIPMVIFIPIYHIWGCVIGYAISFLMLSIFRFIYLRKSLSEHERFILNR